MTVAITRLDLSAMALRERAARAADAKVSRRLLAIGFATEFWPTSIVERRVSSTRSRSHSWTGKPKCVSGGGKVGHVAAA